MATTYPDSAESQAPSMHSNDPDYDALTQREEEELNNLEEESSFSLRPKVERLPTTIAQSR